MHENDLIQDFIYQGQAIDSLWTMFLGVHFALIASVFYAKEKMPKRGKAILCLGYIIFVIINSNAMLIAYDLLEAFRKDICDNAQLSHDVPKHLETLFSKLNYSDRLSMVFSTHLIAALFVLWQILAQGPSRINHRVSPPQ